MSMSPPSAAVTRGAALRAAFVLALGAAVSLGLARFSYALLLPPMRADLGWSYALSGVMNAANAAGYLVGALSLPALTARLGGRRLLLTGSTLAVLFLALHGLLRSDLALLLARAAAGVASGFVFATGGLLAAQLANAQTNAHMATGEQAVSPGLLLGIYYGGTGWGIVLCALGVPWFTEGWLLGALASVTAMAGDAAVAQMLGWPAAWMLLGLLAGVATLLMARWVPADPPEPACPAAATGSHSAGARALAPGIAAYFLFGVGYIGYMTFIVTLLREQGLGAGVVTAFYALLGVGVIVSPWLWAGLLQRERGGGALARLNALLGLAVGLPVLSAHPALVFASGALFGAVFLSVVASTTAMVRHNLPPERWPTGIAAFTVLFAAGQIVGPALVGWVSDRLGGLQPGLALSSAVLFAGALVASRQAPLKPVA